MSSLVSKVAQVRFYPEGTFGCGFKDQGSEAL